MLSLSCGMQDLSLGCVDFSLAVVCKVRAWGLIASVQSVLRPPNSPSQKKNTSPRCWECPWLEKGHLAHDHELFVEISLPTGIIGQCECPCPSPNSRQFRKVIPAKRSFCDDQGPKVFCSILLSFPHIC